MGIGNEHREYWIDVAQRMKLYDAKDAMYARNTKHRYAKVSSVVEQRQEHRI